MSVASKIPPLRFKGFHGAWEAKRLGSVLKIGNGKDYKHLDPGNVPVYGTGGYMTSVSASLASGPSVCIGRKGTIDDPQYLEGPFWTVDTLFYTYGYSGVNAYWLYCQFERMPWRKYSEASGVPSLSKMIIEELGISVPALHEQRQLGSTFRSLDALIADRELAVEKLQTLKKAMLEKMFPRAGAKVPEVRFKGCEGEWERKPLDEIAKKRNESALSGVVPKLEYEDIVSFEGVLKRSLDHLYIEKRGISFYVGDVLFGKLRPYLGNWFHATFDGVAVGDWWVLKPVSVVSEYLYVLIQSDAFQVAANQSAGSKMPRADWNLVSETLYPIPPTVEEQRKIGAYFRSLDALISARQEEVGKLKDMKKALLDRMFV